ncbi:cAMP-binding domain of CRP or a regulatory subunit of cAMP-dependent protein kinases [Ruminococcaceae bacterium FB2012]|nr:cAMP-binding domain of CRP or a regulatory subunit of cAMP-dependent protein kinases [Ruminococcaceae bacterium FB2012]
MNKQIIIEQLASLSEKYNLGIDAGILERIVKLSTFRIIEKGTLIQHIGEKTDTAALVLDGMTRCYYIDSDGNDITRGFSITGTLCMDEGMFGYDESLTEWETLTDTTLMLFNVDGIKLLINGNDALKSAYIRLLEYALKYKIYRENGFLVESASERYLHFRKLFPEICQTVKQQYIATYLGIAPESLSRIKRSLKEV